MCQKCLRCTDVIMHLNVVLPVLDRCFSYVMSVDLFVLRTGSKTDKNGWIVHGPGVIWWTVVLIILEFWTATSTKYRILIWVITVCEVYDLKVYIPFGFMVHSLSYDVDPCWTVGLQCIVPIYIVLIQYCLSFCRRKTRWNVWKSPVF